ncbi:unnamed protein product [Spirodela intermedia]|uniref:Uncharacterized protein n=1 Tax=Spirodela intermedia TaxID=51605 RepID=A0A7I8KEY1_SPIIN|nr:unnamed protein product [Spirodela intermedia]
MGRRVVSGGCHPAERKNSDFAALWGLSPDGEEGVAHTCPYRSKPLEPLLAAAPRLSFRPTCGPGWPAGPPHFAIF